MEINAPDNDFQKDLRIFELSLLSLDEIIADSCLDPNRTKLGFIFGGGKSFIFSPDNYYSETDLTLDFEQPSNPPSPSPSPSPSNESSWQKGDPIIPAEKIVYTPDGRAFLIAAPTPPPAKDNLCQAN